jgi:enoyl-CoA hydratase
MIDLRIDDRGAAGRVATVTVDNAAKLNCMSQPVRAGFLSVFAELAKDDRLRAVVLTGAGDRAFVGGADVRELAALRDEPEAEAFITEVHRCCDAVRQLPVPVIARVRGYVLGAGLELAACCDMRVASSDSHFGMPEVKIGLPSVIEAALLPQLIGWGRTRYLVLTGETVAVADARDWGLFEFVVPPEELDATVERMVAAIVESGPHAVRAQKALVSDWERLPLDAAVRRGIKVLAGAWSTDEPRRMTAERLAEMNGRRKG